MVSLEKNLLRLQRQTVASDFVNKLFQRIHREESLVRLTIINDSNQFQCRQWQTKQNLPFIQKEEESVEVHFYLLTPCPGRKRSSSKIPKDKQHFLWATKSQEMKGDTNDSERLSYHPQ
jgi:hypothetical protein